MAGQLVVGEVADVGELYVALASRLEQRVRFDVRAPQPVIEDACQFAWGRLLHHAGRVRRESALSWLASTAIHEALRMLRCADRELSLDAAIEQTGDAALCAPELGPAELAEHHERLQLTKRLPERQQRLLWLHALGLSYAEIARYTGCTARTVERQLLRAKCRVRCLAAVA